MAISPMRLPTPKALTITGVTVCLVSTFVTVMWLSGVWYDNAIASPFEPAFFVTVTALYWEILMTIGCALAIGGIARATTRQPGWQDWLAVAAILCIWIAAIDIVQPMILDREPSWGPKPHLQQYEASPL